MKTLTLALTLALGSLIAHAQTYTSGGFPVNFPGGKGADCPGGPSIDSKGNLYGFATGGLYGFGTIWKVTSAGVLSVLYNFTTSAGGGSGCVSGSQTLAIHGNYLYGITSNLGIWKLNPTTKKLTVLSTATLVTGSPVFDSAGNLYGYTSDGQGGVFKLTPQGVYSILYAGISGYDRPIIDKAGNLFGVTTFGGQNGVGLVWELSASGVYSEIYSFSGNPSGGTTDGALPYARLSQDQAGNLYGTTYVGGTLGQGTVFVISNGVETVLTDFSSFYPANPEGPVVRDSVGNLYGTLPSMGIPKQGGVWQMVALGGGQYAQPVIVDTPENFEGEVIVIDKSDNFYGISYVGGDSTLFKN